MSMLIVSSYDRNATDSPAKPTAETTKKKGNTIQKASCGYPLRGPQTSALVSSFGGGLMWLRGGNSVVRRMNPKDYDMDPSGDSASLNARIADTLAKRSTPAYDGTAKTHSRMLWCHYDHSRILPTKSEQKYTLFCLRKHETSLNVPRLPFTDASAEPTVTWLSCALASFTIAHSFDLSNTTPNGCFVSKSACTSISNVGTRPSDDVVRRGGVSEFRFPPPEMALRFRVTRYCALKMSCQMRPDGETQ